MAESRDQTLKLQKVWTLLADLRREFVRAMLQDARILARIDGETMIVVRNVELASLRAKDEFQFATFQHDPIMIMKNWHEHFSVKFVFYRMPVNIEKARIDGGFAILENVQPPRIVAAHDSHVVGDDVEDQSHAMLVQGAYKAVKVFGATDFRVQRIVIDDVVSVHAAGARL